MTDEKTEAFLTKVRACKNTDEVQALVSATAGVELDRMHAELAEEVSGKEEGFIEALRLATDIANSAVEFVATRAEMADVKQQLVVIVAARLLRENAQRLMDGKDPNFPAVLAQLVDEKVTEAIRSGGIRAYEK